MPVGKHDHRDAGLAVADVLVLEPLGRGLVVGQSEEEIANVLRDDCFVGCRFEVRFEFANLQVLFHSYLGHSGLGGRLQNGGGDAFGFRLGYPPFKGRHGHAHNSRCFGFVSCRDGKFVYGTL